MSDLTTCADECGSWLQGECDCGANASRLRARITDLEAQLAAKDALIRELVGAIRSAENYIANTEREFDIELSSGKKARAALTRAKEMGYE